ncbi:MAG: mechanosensitive ion channel family protein [Bacteroidia bacterium]
MKDISTIITSSLEAVLIKVSSFLPGFIGGLVLLIVGWLLALGLKKLIHAILSRKIIKEQIDKIADTITSNGAERLNPIEVFSKIVYWFVFLIFLLSATEAMGLQMLSQQISALIQYLPKLITALFIFLMGVYVASGIRDAVGTAAKAMGIKPWRVLSSIVFYLISLFVGVTALNQAGIDTQIITSNMTVIIAGLMLAFALAYSFAARPFLAGILSASYTKTHFKVGQIIEIEGNTGKIAALDNVSVVLENEQGKIILPSQKLLTDKVIIVQEAKEND